MNLSNSPDLFAHFKDIIDPRVERTKDHSLLDIITIAVCAVICGADDGANIEVWGKYRGVGQ